MAYGMNQAGKNSVMGLFPDGWIYSADVEYVFGKYSSESYIYWNPGNFPEDSLFPKIRTDRRLMDLKEMRYRRDIFIPKKGPAPDFKPMFPNGAPQMIPSDKYEIKTFHQWGG